mgnify:CR=1 FL=1
MVNLLMDKEKKLRDEKLDLPVNFSDGTLQVIGPTVFAKWVLGSKTDC